MSRTVQSHVVCVFALGALALMWGVSPLRAADDPMIEQWDIFEVNLTGPSKGNPFVDVQLSARFEQQGRVFEPEGFYDGQGRYRIRFMPDTPGLWEYVTKSNRTELDGKRGRFVCEPAKQGNHGPVRVHKKWYLRYADGTPYFQIGTTCYAWVHQGDEMEQQTLRTLNASPFNKIRMCVFPKDYSYNKNEPQYYPFVGKPLTDWDYTRFEPAFWKHFETRVGQLRDLGIEADLILFHPYDRWGFQKMTAETDARYLRYVVARLAAFRNVWWSFANEFDLMKSKTMADWDRFFQIVQKADPYNRLRGIHNCRGFYDHTKPWVTHCSVQSSDLAGARKWRDQYGKPVIYDECKYEGNIPQGWGNITAEELVHRFWLATIAGCYAGHGETYQHPEDLLWWSKGGVLHGQSPARIAFLKKIMAPVPFDEMTPSEWPGSSGLLAKAGRLYLVYLGGADTVDLDLPGSRPYKFDLIDTWNMTVTPLGTARPGRFSYNSPRGRMLLRLAVYEPGERLRPRVKASARPSVGLAPLTVSFSASGEIKKRWDFGDGATSTEANPTHTYDEPGLYTAMLTATDEAGLSTSVPFAIVADRPVDTPIVRVGFADGDRPTTKLTGDIARSADGTFTLPDREPWRWISVADEPLKDLEGLRSFTILGWANPSSLEIGSGGNRLAFTLNHDRDGFDLVHLQDGRLRLAVNEWPDRVRNDSFVGKLAIGKWTFFAVTYDATQSEDNVKWYFGDEKQQAALDRTTGYNRGPTGTDGGPLTIGNYNRTLHGAGKDRQFRGKLRGIEIFGSRISARGALSLAAIRKHQTEGAP